LNNISKIFKIDENKIRELFFSKIDKNQKNFLSVDEGTFSILKFFFGEKNGFYRKNSILFN
jgi:hypothetical protein